MKRQGGVEGSWLPTQRSKRDLLSSIWASSNMTREMKQTVIGQK